MNKVFCDICKKECKQPCHIACIALKKLGKGRFDLCPKCYVSELKRLRKLRNKKVGARFKIFRNMFKKLTGVSLVALGLSLFASKAFAATSTIFTWSASTTEDLTAWIYQVWSDFSTPVVLVLGVSIGFVLLRKLVGAIKTSAR